MQKKDIYIKFYIILKEIINVWEPGKLLPSTHSYHMIKATEIQLPFTETFSYFFHVTFSSNKRKTKRFEAYSKTLSFLSWFKTLHYELLVMYQPFVIVSLGYCHFTVVSKSLVKLKLCIFLHNLRLWWSIDRPTKTVEFQSFVFSYPQPQRVFSSVVSNQHFPVGRGPSESCTLYVLSFGWYKAWCSIFFSPFWCSISSLSKWHKSTLT